MRNSSESGVGPENGTDDPDGQQGRRKFLKTAAAVGVAGAVWSEPLVRGVPAYAQTTSVNGQCTGQFIEWTSMMARWSDTSGTLSGLDTTCTASNGATFTFTPTTGVDMMTGLGPCTTLTANVVLTATGIANVPSSSDDCVGMSPGATVAITSGASCIISNLMTNTTAMATLLGGAMGFTFEDANNVGKTEISFDIIC